MDVLDHIISVISDKFNKIVEAHVKSALDDHIRSLRETIQKHQEAITEQKDGWFVVFNATFNNISVVSYRSVVLVYPEGTIDLSKVTDKLYHIML